MSPPKKRPSTVSSKSASAIAAKGEDLYARRFAREFEHYRGKYLAIDVDNERAYLADSPRQALALAQTTNPQGSFHIVKIGFEGLYRVASYGQRLVR